MKKSKSGFWICVLPALICFAMVVLIPAITGLLYSFTDWNGMNKPVSFPDLRITGDLSVIKCSGGIFFIRQYFLS